MDYPAGAALIVPQKWRDAVLPAGSISLQDLPLPDAGKEAGQSVVWIPVERFTDFVAGEGERGNCTFVKSGIQRQDPADIKKLQHNSRLERWDMRCCHAGAPKVSEAKLQQAVLERGQPELRQARLHQVAECSQCSVCERLYVPGLGCLCPDSADKDSDGIMEECVLSQLSGQRRSSQQAGEVLALGCCCRFSVVRYVSAARWLKLTFKQSRHVIADGVACHGPECATAAGSRRAVEAHLPEDVRSWAEQQLRAGLPADQIIRANRQRCLEEIMAKEGIDKDAAREKLARSPPRGLFMSRDDLDNMKAKLDKATWRKHPDEATSVRMLVQERPEDILLYQELKLAQPAAQHDGSDAATTPTTPASGAAPKGSGEVQQEQPFMIGVMTAFQVMLASYFGNMGALLLDSTFALNKHMYACTTAMVMDHSFRGQAVAFLLASRETAKDFVDFLQAMTFRIRQQNPAWMPSCVFIDVCVPLIQAIRIVLPGVAIALCSWHVKRAWLNAVNEKITDQDDRLSAFLCMSEVMHYNPAIGTEEELRARVNKMLDDLCRDFAKYPKFTQYVRSQWVNHAEINIDMWVQGFWRFNRSKQTGTQALEGYHHAKKEAYFYTVKRIAGRRIDWALDVLLNMVEPDIFFQQLAALHGFVRNDTQEALTAAALVQTEAIPPEDVLYCGATDTALVRSQTDRSIMWEVRGVSYHWARCNCPQGRQGLLCKHQLRTLQLVYRFTPGQLLEDLGTAVGSARGGTLNPLDRLMSRLPGAAAEAVAVAAAEAAAAAVATDADAAATAAAGPPSPIAPCHAAVMQPQQPPLGAAAAGSANEASPSLAGVQPGNVVAVAAEADMPGAAMPWAVAAAAPAMTAPAAAARACLAASASASQATGVPAEPSARPSVSHTGAMLGGGLAFTGSALALGAFLRHAALGGDGTRLLLAGPEPAIDLPASHASISRVRATCGTLAAAGSRSERHAEWALAAARRTTAAVLAPAAAASMAVPFAAQSSTARGPHAAPHPAAATVPSLVAAGAAIVSVIGRPTAAGSAQQHTRHAAPGTASFCGMGVREAPLRAVAAGSPHARLPLHALGALARHKAVPVSSGVAAELAGPLAAAGAAPAPPAGVASLRAVKQACADLLAAGSKSETHAARAEAAARRAACDVLRLGDAAALKPPPNVLTQVSTAVRSSVRLKGRFEPGRGRQQAKRGSLVVRRILQRAMAVQRPDLAPSQQLVRVRGKRAKAPKGFVAQLVYKRDQHIAKQAKAEQALNGGGPRRGRGATSGTGARAPPAPGAVPAAQLQPELAVPPPAACALPGPQQQPQDRQMPLMQLAGGVAVPHASAHMAPGRSAAAAAGDASAPVSTYDTLPPHNMRSALVPVASAAASISAMEWQQCTLPEERPDGSGGATLRMPSGPPLPQEQLVHAVSAAALKRPRTAAAPSSTSGVLPVAGGPGQVVPVRCSGPSAAHDGVLFVDLYLAGEKACVHVDSPHTLAALKALRPEKPNSRRSGRAVDMASLQELEQLSGKKHRTPLVTIMVGHETLKDWLGDRAIKRQRTEKQKQ